MDVLIISYINRSGSTYLSNKLNTLKKVYVTIEANLFSYLINNPFIKNNKDKSDLISFIRNDRKLKEWDISISYLMECIANKEVPFDAGDILLLLTEIIRINNNDELVVFKNPGFHKILNIVEDKVNINLIYLDRDPRAIYNSQTKSLNSQSNSQMADNVIRFAHYYSKVQFELKKITDKENVTIISYEDLILNEDKTINKLVNKLHLNKSTEYMENQNSYVNRLPEAQKKLHMNVEKGGIKSRVDAFIDELNNFHYYFLSKAFNLNIEKKEFSFIDKLKTTLSLIVFYIFYIKR